MIYHGSFSQPVIVHILMTVIAHLSKSVTQLAHLHQRGDWRSVNPFVALISRKALGTFPADHNVGRNKVHSSMVQCGQLATTYLWCILLWRAESGQRRETSCIVRGQARYLNFSIDYPIRTMRLLSASQHKWVRHKRVSSEYLQAKRWAEMTE